LSKVCVARGRPWHVTCWGRGTPQHWPKKSQGGTEVVAYPCWPLHDAIDNGVKLDGLRLWNRVEGGVYQILERGSDRILMEVALPHAYALRDKKESE
jgi:hypothetical protein